MHRNPVARGLVALPEDWPWSSYSHYLTGVEGTVEIESEWTARRRERIGMVNRIEAISRPRKQAGRATPIHRRNQGNESMG